MKTDIKIELKGIDKITQELEKMQKSQDNVMQISRDIIRLCGITINKVHCRDMNAAKKNIITLNSKIRKLKNIEKGFEYYSAQARQEYVEAFVVYSIISKGVLPSNSEMKEDPRNYIMGIMDVVGEMKREAFEAMRSKDYDSAEKYYNIMKEIYDSTMHIRFANALLHDFRRKQDVARIVLESTGSELMANKNRQ
jgi:translin